MAGNDVRELAEKWSLLDCSEDFYLEGDENAVGVESLIHNRLKIWA